MIFFLGLKKNVFFTFSYVCRNLRAHFADVYESALHGGSQAQLDCYGISKRFSLKLKHEIGSIERVSTWLSSIISVADRCVKLKLPLHAFIKQLVNIAQQDLQFWLLKATCV